jgi:alpha-L-rhamnosidase
MPSKLDLSPAKWIWLPSGRTLPSCFAIFRREFSLAELPDVCQGHLGADSRYLIWVNGQRVQWGPAPHDPRHAEIDPIDLAPWIRKGQNCIAVMVLYYGHPEGTWPFGQPGLIFSCPILGLVTDESWTCLLDPTHTPGRPPRWYLRALQEVRDLRQEPAGWKEAGFDDSAWLPAKPTGAPSSMSAAAGRHGVYSQDWSLVGADASTLSLRSIPLMKEEIIEAKSLLASHRVHWAQPPSNWFDFRMEKAFSIERASLEPQHFSWGPAEGALFTYDFGIGRAGFPIIEIEAPAGTEVEVMAQESAPEGDPGWLESSFYSWSRFTCTEGVTRFEAFDYEALRLLQIHVHGSPGHAKVRFVGLRSREYPFPHQPKFRVSDPEIQRVLEANVQTLRLSNQDITVDGMARERQQYSGDCGHQIRTLRQAFGAWEPGERFLRTYAKGQLLDGIFCDSWPAADRLQRLWQREMGLTTWGAIIDHSVGFVFDHWLHYWETGRLGVIQENWPALIRLLDGLESRLKDGLVDPTDTGDRVIWIDHEAYRSQEEKELAFNLYLAGMLKCAYAPLAQALGDEAQSARALALADHITSSCTTKWWDEGWQNSKDGRIDDRALASALLFDLGEADPSALHLLAELPEGVGRSYPANVVWNVWALTSRGLLEPCLQDLRSRWADLPSVRNNGTLQEMWDAGLGSIHLMAHCAVAPLAVLYDGLAGLTCLAPGFSRARMRPLLGSLEWAELEVHTPLGPISLRMDQKGAWVTSPAGMELEVLIENQPQTAAPNREDFFPWGPSGPGGTTVKQERTGPFPPIIQIS